MVRDGRIDTLIVAITDMQGRLVGKRVQAQAFLAKREIDNAGGAYLRAAFLYEKIKDAAAAPASAGGTPDAAVMKFFSPPIIPDAGL